MNNNNLLVSMAILMAVILASFTSLHAQKPNDRKVVKLQTNLDCESCKQKIEKYMAFEKGVTSVDAEVKTKIVTIGYRSSRTTEQKLIAAIEKLGYTATVIEEEKTD